MDYVISEEQLEKILEQSAPEVDRVIIKLFQLLDAEKKQSKTRKDLLEVIKKYSPYFNVPSGFELYILELYLLNYRKDGDYSGLTKDNFVDPRDAKGKSTTNSTSDLYTKAQLPFNGSNLRGFWRTRGGNKYYVVESWGWYPVFIFRNGIWYENINRYSSSTSRQMYRSQPYSYNSELDSKVYLLTRDEMEMVERGVSHEDIMKSKREKLKKIEPELKSKRKSIERVWDGANNQAPSINIKFKINSIEEEGDKVIVNVDIYDVVKREYGKSIPTPENYLKGEIPNITAEKVENDLKKRLRMDFRQYLGPKFKNTDKGNVEFKFNHLKK